MSNDNLTPGEVAILLALMAEARELTNKELEELYGFVIKAEQRRKLSDLKLLETEQKIVGTSSRKVIVHLLSNSGWNRCQELLAAGRPVAARGTANGALYAILAGLGRFLGREDRILSEVFQPATAASTVTTTEEPPPSPAAPSSDLESRIRAGYAQLTRRAGGWVKLSALRGFLGETAKSEVDDVLRQMDRNREVVIIPEENQKTLTEEDRAAAIKIGGKNNHLLKIENA